MIFTQSMNVNELFMKAFHRNKNCFQDIIHCKGRKKGKFCFCIFFVKEIGFQSNLIQKYLLSNASGINSTMADDSKFIVIYT